MFVYSAEKNGISLLIELMVCLVQGRGRRETIINQIMILTWSLDVATQILYRLVMVNLWHTCHDRLLALKALKDLPSLTQTFHIQLSGIILLTTFFSVSFSCFCVIKNANDCLPRSFRTESYPYPLQPLCLLTQSTTTVIFKNSPREFKVLPKTTDLVRGGAKICLCHAPFGVGFL